VKSGLCRTKRKSIVSDRGYTRDGGKGGRGLTLLNVVVGKCSAILELLSGENESLLIGRDTLLVLDLGLDCRA
jgi:hypothetical protein